MPALVGLLWKVCCEIRRARFVSYRGGMARLNCFTTQTTPVNETWWLFPSGALRERPCAVTAWEKKETLERPFAENETTTGSLSGNDHFFFVTPSYCVPPPRIGVASYKCQSERGTHSLWLHIQRCPPAPSIVSLCSENASCWEQTTAGQRANSQSAPASSFGTPGWDSRRRVPPRSLILGLCHPLPGRCAPSAWPNRPTGSAVTTSTSAFPRERWATRPLTHRVCSRGPIGGKCWGRSESLSRVALQRGQERDGWYRQCRVRVLNAVSCNSLDCSYC